MEGVYGGTLPVQFCTYVKLENYTIIKVWRRWRRRRRRRWRSGIRDEGSLGDTRSRGHWTAIEEEVNCNTAEGMDNILAENLRCVGYSTGLWPEDFP